MHAIVRKDSRVEGKGDDAQVIVNRVRVTTLESARRAGVIFQEGGKAVEKSLPAGGTRIVTIDGQKLDFDAQGRMVAGGVEETKQEKEASGRPQIVETQQPTPSAPSPSPAPSPGPTK